MAQTTEGGESAVAPPPPPAPRVPPPPGRTQHEAPKYEQHTQPIAGCQVLRKTGEDACVPETEDGGYTWLIPFAPQDGEERRIFPGQMLLIQTGIRLYVPRGVVAIVSQPYANGKPGLQLPVMEVDHRYEGELVVPIRNLDAKTPIVLRPGGKPYPIVVRFIRIGEPVTFRVDRGADPLS